MANNVPSPLIRIEYGKYNPVFSEKGKLETLILASIISRIRSPSSVADTGRMMITKNRGFVDVETKKKYQDAGCCT